MKRYLAYAIILGFIGHSLGNTGSHVMTANNTQAKLERIGV